MKRVAERRGKDEAPRYHFCWVCLLCEATKFAFLDACIMHLRTAHQIFVCQVDLHQGFICQP